MQRILLILALAILLLPPRPSAKGEPVATESLLVSATRLPLSSDPAIRRAGLLDFIAGWSLTSASKDFGGISSMVLAGEGGMIALSDSGVLMGFDLTARHRRQFIAPLPIRPSERGWPTWKWDSESMVHDSGTGRYWVGFELIDRICRYAPGFARVESCRTWPEMEAWPNTGGAEAMARLPDGRFLVFSEMGYAPDGPGNDVLLFAGDPADARTPHPIHLRYRPPEGYRPTDAVWLGKGQLLVLNRRVTLAEGFTAVVALVTLPPLRSGAELVVKPLARLAPPLLADNFEAMALGEEKHSAAKGPRILWIASDDNHEFFQRTLLLKFALPDSLGR